MAKRVKRRKNSTGAKRMREQGYGEPLATFLRLLALAYVSTADERKQIRLQLQGTEWHAWNALISVLPARMDDEDNRESEITGNDR